MNIVWSVALHGSETWTLRTYERDRLEAFDIWTWCNMENISWKDHMTTEYVRNEKAMAWTRLERRKSCEGSADGRKESKRKATYHVSEKIMLDDIKAEGTYAEIKRRALDRECWRKWMPRTFFQAEHQ